MSVSEDKPYKSNMSGLKSSKGGKVGINLGGSSDSSIRKSNENEPTVEE